MKNKEALDLIKNHKGILLGSRAFGVEKEDSDWDVAITAADLPSKYIDEVYLDIRKYFFVLPLGNSWLIKVQNLDILVFEDNVDFCVMLASVNELKSIPKYFLESKNERIRLFEIALRYYGFKNADIFDDDVAF
jgi:predicted nucleotidyltransferase